MADLVVSIDGDSKGLVGSLQKADGAMGDMRAEAKKLSDQLREVADDADKAAGELITKLGGPGAIKAIAGVGIAFGAVKTGVETFIDSSERMFQSYGDKGRQMWDKVEESLRGVNGAFAEVSLGSGDLADKAARLQTMGEGVKSIWSSMLAPLGSLLDQFQQMAINVAGLTTREAELAAQYRATTIAIQEQGNAYTIAAQMMADAEVIAMGLLGMEKQAAAAAHARTQEKLIEARQTMQNAIVEREFAKELANTNDYFGNSAELIAKAGVALDAFSDVDTQAIKIMKSGNLTNNEKASAISGLKMAYEKITPAIEDYDEAMVYATDSERESLDLVTQAAFAPAKKAAGVAAHTAALKDNISAIQDMSFEFGIMERRRQEAIANAALVDRYGTVGLEGTDEEILADARKNETMAQRRIEIAKAADIEHLKADKEFRDARAASDAEWEREQEARKKKEVDDTKSAVTQNIQQYGRLTASVITGEKSMADAAREAIGNILSAKGDEYAVKAGALFFENPTASAGYAVASLAAYTAASALGATDKPVADKQKGETPATERESAKAQNVTYALRVDAAFADGESIARRFSQMQAAAQTRGLVGAYGAA
jgi:hypothetical protein